jgi:hypothetical protein
VSGAPQILLGDSLGSRGRSSKETSSRQNGSIEHIDCQLIMMLNIFLQAFVNIYVKAN